MRIKETLKSVLSQFQSERLTSDKGVIDVQKAGDEIAVGDTIVLVDEEGVESQAESGEYLLTDGTILKVEDGKIVEIVVPEVEAPAEEPVEEEAPAEEEPVVEEPAQEEEKPEEEEAPAQEEEKPAEEEAPAQEEENAEVAALRAEIAEKDARIAELEARIAELEKKPAAEPATEEFKKVNKIYKTGYEKLDRLAKIMGA
jgi:pyruvate/2-oxoglutarate dehydrogenase complex dihydrolipoamide acyltransferase (E2) component